MRNRSGTSNVRAVSLRLTLLHFFDRTHMPGVGRAATIRTWTLCGQFMHQNRKSGRSRANEPDSDWSCSACLVRLFEDLSRSGLSTQEDVVARLDLSTRIPHQSFLQTLVRARSRVGDTVGLRAAYASRSDTFGVLEYLLRTSATPLDGLQSVAKYVRLMHDCARLVLSRRDDFVVVRFEIAGGLECPVEISEFTLASLRLCFQRVSSVPCQISEVRFSADPPGNPRVRQLLFGCNVVYGSPMDALVIRADQMSTPIPHADVTLNALLQSYAHSILTAQHSTRPLSERVKEIVLEQLSDGIDGHGSEDLARGLSMSLRTLNRRLAKEQTSYRAIVDAVRAELAFEYLSHEDVSLSEVSAKLGFSHVNAFRRAFRRWTSQRPTDLRRQLKKG